MFFYLYLIENTMSSLTKSNTLSNAPTLEELQRIRQFLDTHPDMLKAVSGQAKVGRKKGVKVPTIEEGNILEVEEPRVQEVEITPEEAKKMLKKPRKPRVMSDETKAKMAEILAKGREALRAKREAEKAQQVEVPPTPKVVKKSKVPEGYEGETIVKKYVIKAKEKAPPRPRKQVIRREEDYDDEDIDADLPTETSESEMSDATLLRKIQKKTKAIKKIDNVLTSTASLRRDPFRR